MTHIRTRYHVNNMPTDVIGMYGQLSNFRQIAALPASQSGQSNHFLPSNPGGQAAKPAGHKAPRASRRIWLILAQLLQNSHQ
jgi:hypothetical protein